MKRTAIILTATVVSVMAAVAQPKLTADNVKEVVKAMTLEEKASLVVGTQRWGVYPPEPAPGMPVRPQKEEGVTTAFSDGRVKGAAGDVYALPKFGIPSMVLADGPAGVRIDPTRPNDSNTYYCTAFPTSSLLAATWDVDLVEKMTLAIGEEARDYGIDILLAPGVNIMRNPLCGRNYEYFSEDPLLAGKMAAAYIRGVQAAGVGVSLKHFAVNNQETYRNGINAIVDEETLSRIYLRPFEIAVKEGKPWTIMSSYNKINGTLASENRWLLKDVLRHKWGFDGFVMTDWWAEENGARQIAAGNDMLMPGTERQKQEIIKGIENGTLDEKDLDWCVENILRIVLKSHSFNGYRYSNKPDLKAHAAIARRVASDGMVLLENNGALPFERGKVALVGVNSYYALVGGSGSGNVNRKYEVSICEGLTAAGLDVDRAVAERYKDYVNAEKSKHATDGTAFWIVPTIDEIAVTKENAVEMARRNDVCILTIGRMAGEGSDRRLQKGDYYLSDLEMQNLKTLCAAFHNVKKKVIVLLSMGNMVDMAAWKDLPDAILHTWLAGQESGNAVADVVTGKVSPSGRLPFTIARQYSDYPSAANFPLSDNNPSVVRYSEGSNVGYRHFDNQNIKPLYPFGYGLSYTSFEYGKPVVHGTTVELTLKNVGQRPGKEVVQLYVGKENRFSNDNVINASVMRKELRHFQKVNLQPSETATVTFTLNDSDFQFYDNGWKTEPGTFTLYIGSSSTDIRQRAMFRR